MTGQSGESFWCLFFLFRLVTRSSSSSRHWPKTAALWRRLFIPSFCPPVWIITEANNHRLPLVLFFSFFLSLFSRHLYRSIRHPSNGNGSPGLLKHNKHRRRLEQEWRARSFLFWIMEKWIFLFLFFWLLQNGFSASFIIVHIRSLQCCRPFLFVPLRVDDHYVLLGRRIDIISESVAVFPMLQQFRSKLFCSNFFFFFKRRKTFSRRHLTVAYQGLRWKWWSAAFLFEKTAQSVIEFN